jgi:hypothetical protein
MVRRRGPPSQGWKTFLRNHADGIAAMDVFVVPTVSFRLLYGLLIMAHGRRQILWLGVTAHPTAEWIANQLMAACGWEQLPHYLIRDRDVCYGGIFVRRVRSLGIRDHPTSPRSPWQNGYVERLIGSIRRECLDHIVVVGEQHLRHILMCYMEYYNTVRTHLSLGKDAPVRRTIQRAGRIEARPVLGGLHQSIRADLIFDRDTGLQDGKSLSGSVLPAAHAPPAATLPRRPRTVINSRRCMCRPKDHACAIPTVYSSAASEKWHILRCPLWANSGLMRGINYRSTRRRVRPLSAG